MFAEKIGRSSEGAGSGRNAEGAEERSMFGLIQEYCTNKNSKRVFLFACLKTPAYPAYRQAGGRQARFLARSFGAFSYTEGSFYFPSDPPLAPN